MSKGWVHHYSAYDREYAKHDNAKQRARAKARYWMVKKYGEAALRGKDVDHIHPAPVSLQSAIIALTNRIDA